VRNVVTPANASVRTLVLFSESLNKRSIIRRILSANTNEPVNGYPTSSLPKGLG
jgi:hypothetical protein